MKNEETDHDLGAVSATEVDSVSCSVPAATAPHDATLPRPSFTDFGHALTLETMLPLWERDPDAIAALMAGAAALRERGL